MPGCGPGWKEAWFEWGARFTWACSDAGTPGSSRGSLLAGKPGCLAGWVSKSRVSSLGRL